MFVKSLGFNSMGASIGIIVNPRSGGDIRRAVAAAGRSTLEEKVSIVRRIVLGARASGVDNFFVNYEPMQIVRRATETIRNISITYVNKKMYFTEEDSTLAARAMALKQIPAVAVLGGDGTNRAVVKGWPDIPLLPVSTGTNNAFPEFFEPTVAGTTLGLVATKVVSLEKVSERAKIIHISVDNSESEIALIDAVAVSDPYVGSLELFRPETMELAVLTRADPTAIGFSAIGGLLHPLSPQEDKGLLVRFAPISNPETQYVLHAPTAPGHHEPIGIVSYRELDLGETVLTKGKTILAFDGERKVRVKAGQIVEFEIRRDGPWVIQPQIVMEAGRGSFLEKN